ncbi:MAG: transcriptional regulator [Candidatus Heimdallarchaeota archaeon]|nr:MAG: transcriptional regulator [Candidatus Heimdallarchaeota archaeon]
MTDWVNNFREIDPVLFNAKRLLIISLLVALGPLTQGDLQKKCQLTWGALTAHIKQLQKAQYIEQRHVITLKGPRALVDITQNGIQVYHNTLVQLKAFVDKLEKDKEL